MSVVENPVPRFIVLPDTPQAADVQHLLTVHLDFAHQHGPPEDVHALDVDGLLDVGISFFSIRDDGHLLGIGALKHLDGNNCELKSIHTAESARGRGVGRAMVEHLIGEARSRGYKRLSLETGSMDAFAPSRSLYEMAGFRQSGPFGSYVSSPNSTFMTLIL